MKYIVTILSILSLALFASCGDDAGGEDANETNSSESNSS